VTKYIEYPKYNSNSSSLPLLQFVDMPARQHFPTGNGGKDCCPLGLIQRVDAVRYVDPEDVDDDGEYFATNPPPPSIGFVARDADGDLVWLYDTVEAKALGGRGKPKIGQAVKTWAAYFPAQTKFFLLSRLRANVGNQHVLQPRIPMALPFHNNSRVPIPTAHQYWQEFTGVAGQQQLMIGRIQGTPRYLAECNVPSDHPQLHAIIGYMVQSASGTVADVYTAASPYVMRVVDYQAEDFDVNEHWWANKTFRDIPANLKKYTDSAGNQRRKTFADFRVNPDRRVPVTTSAEAHYAKMQQQQQQQTPAAPREASSSGGETVPCSPTPPQQQPQQRMTATARRSITPTPSSPKLRRKRARRISTSSDVSTPAKRTPPSNTDTATTTVARKDADVTRAELGKPSASFSLLVDDGEQQASRRQRVVLSSGNSGFKCRVAGCTFEATDSNNMDRHESSYGALYRCPTCVHSFKQKRDLERHRRVCTTTTIVVSSAAITTIPVNHTLPTCLFFRSRGSPVTEMKAAIAALAAVHITEPPPACPSPPPPPPSTAKSPTPAPPPPETIVVEPMSITAPPPPIPEATVDQPEPMAVSEPPPPPKSKATAGIQEPLLALELPPAEIAAAASYSEWKQSQQSALDRVFAVRFSPTRCHNYAFGLPKPQQRSGLAQLPAPVIMDAPPSPRNQDERPAEEQAPPAATTTTIRDHHDSETLSNSSDYTPPPPPPPPPPPAASEQSVQTTNRVASPVAPSPPRIPPCPIARPAEEALPINGLVRAPRTPSPPSSPGSGAVSENLAKARTRLAGALADDDTTPIPRPVTAETRAARDDAMYVELAGRFAYRPTRQHPHADGKLKRVPLDDGTIGYMCRRSGCPYKTGHSGCMRRHEDKHAGVRYPCLKCGKEFTQKNNLRRHSSRCKCA